MKKILLIVAAILGVLVILFTISGFVPINGVFLGEYMVMEDNSSIEMQVGVSSSIGFIGRYSVKWKDQDAYITFYNTFGGINSSLGANNKVVLELPEACDAIYFKNGSEYDLKLTKNSETDKWERAPLK